MKRYVDEAMVPRSLRWKVFPEKYDKEFDEWFTYFNKAGIVFLKEEERKDPWGSTSMVLWWYERDNLPITKLWGQR